MPLRALLIEDDTLQASVTARLLASAGFEVTTATNGADALNHLTDNEFDLCVVDLNLPDITGNSLIQMLRTGPHGITTKIIAVTASNDQVDMEMAFHGGADDVYPKAIGAAVLAAKFASTAAKFLAERRVAHRLENLETRMVAHVDEMEACSVDKDEKIAALAESLSGIHHCLTELVGKVDGVASDTKEIVDAWGKSRAMVKGLKAMGGFIKAVWPVWVVLAASVTFITTGKFTWPKL